MRPWIIDLQKRTIPHGVEVSADPVGVAVSADGRWLAVVQSYGIDLVPSDGSAPARRLTTGKQDRWPSFRPSGKEILFTRGTPPEAQVMTIDLEQQTEPVRLLAEATQAIASPTDARVAYLAGTTSTALVPRILDLRTGASTPLTKELEPARYTGIDFSPDGSRVLVVRDRRDILEFDARTGAPRRTLHVDDTIKRIHYVGDDIDVVRVTWLGDLWVADDPF
jgi:Tol biopolymer transport system component